jgi:aryl-alcohol dehydrogenase-like predicted oxidoreductase
MGGANDIKWLLDDNFLRHVQNLKPIAADVGLSMPQLAIAWVLQNPNVSAAIVGASRPEQLADNAAASGVTLDDEIRKRIDEALAGVILADASLTFSPNPRPGSE